MRGRPRKEVVTKASEAVRRSRVKHPDRYRLQVRQWHLKRAYGLTIYDYDAMMVKQDGCCAICGGRYVNVYGDPLYVDRDHATNRVRGLLCHRCNIVLGFIEKDKSLMHKVLAYLSSFT